MEREISSMRLQVEAKKKSLISIEEALREKNKRVAISGRVMASELELEFESTKAMIQKNEKSIGIAEKIHRKVRNSS